MNIKRLSTLLLFSGCLFGQKLNLDNIYIAPHDSTPGTLGFGTGFSDGHTFTLQAPAAGADVTYVWPSTSPSTGDCMKVSAWNSTTKIATGAFGACTGGSSSIPIYGSVTFSTHTVPVGLVTEASLPILDWGNNDVRVGTVDTSQDGGFCRVDTRGFGNGFFSCWYTPAGGALRPTIFAESNGDFIMDMTGTGALRIKAYPSGSVTNIFPAQASFGGFVQTQDSVNVGGAISLFDNATQTLSCGLATEVNATLLEFGCNDVRFVAFKAGGSTPAYNSAYQTAFFRMDSRANDGSGTLPDPLQIWVRPIGAPGIVQALSVKADKTTRTWGNLEPYADGGSNYGSLTSRIGQTYSSIVTTNSLQVLDSTAAWSGQGTGLVLHSQIGAHTELNIVDQSGAKFFIANRTDLGSNADANHFFTLDGGIRFTKKDVFDIGQDPNATTGFNNEVANLWLQNLHCSGLCFTFPILAHYPYSGNNYYYGIVTEPTPTIPVIDIGANDDATNRFGGSYVSSMPGGFFRVDPRGGTNPMFAFYFRPVFGTAVDTTMELYDSGVIKVRNGIIPKVDRGAYIGAHGSLTPPTDQVRFDTLYSYNVDAAPYCPPDPIFPDDWCANAHVDTRVLYLHDSDPHSGRQSIAATLKATWGPLGNSSLAFYNIQNMEVFRMQYANTFTPNVTDLQNMTLVDLTVAHDAPSEQITITSGKITVGGNCSVLVLCLYQKAGQLFQFNTPGVMTALTSTSTPSTLYIYMDGVTNPSAPDIRVGRDATKVTSVSYTGMVDMPGVTAFPSGTLYIPLYTCNVVSSAVTACTDMRVTTVPTIGRTGAEFSETHTKDLYITGNCFGAACGGSGASPYIYVKSKGAVCDGSPHALGTLNASSGTTPYPLTLSAYGLSASDQTDWAAIQESILTVIGSSPPQQGQRVMLPAGICMVNRTINIGNGHKTATETSTYHGTILQGEGRGTAKIASAGYLVGATMIRYNGSSSSTTPVIAVNGPIGAPQILDLYIDAAGLAGFGIDSQHAQWFNYERLEIMNPTVAGIRYNSYGSVDTSSPAEGSRGVTRDVAVKSIGTCTAVGLEIGNGSAPSGGLDVQSSLWDNVYVRGDPTLCSGGDSRIGVRINYADSLFLTHMYVADVSQSLVFKRPTGAANFPQQITVSETVLQGATLTALDTANGSWAPTGWGATFRNIYQDGATGNGVCPTWGGSSVWCTDTWGHFTGARTFEAAVAMTSTLSVFGAVSSTGPAGGFNVTADTLWNSIQTVGGIRASANAYIGFGSSFSPSSFSCGVTGCPVVGTWRVSHLQMDGNIVGTVHDGYAGLPVIKGRYSACSLTNAFSLDDSTCAPAPGATMLSIGGHGHVPTLKNSPQPSGLNSWFNDSANAAINIAAVQTFTTAVQSTEINWQTTGVNTNTRSQVASLYKDQFGFSTLLLGQTAAHTIVQTPGSYSCGGIRYNSSTSKMQFNNDCSVAGWTDFGTGSGSTGVTSLAPFGGSGSAIKTGAVSLQGGTGITITDGGGQIITITAASSSVPWTAVPSSIIPNLNVTRDLGSSSFQWNNLYVQSVNAQNTTSFGYAITDSVGFNTGFIGGQFSPGGGAYMALRTSGGSDYLEIAAAVFNWLGSVPISSTAGFTTTSAYKASGSTGITNNINVKGSTGANCKINVVGGIVTGSTCPMDF